MPKRFTATEKWDDPWFLNLYWQDKLFWDYLLSKCDHAGIWKVYWSEVKLKVSPNFEYRPEVFKGRIMELSEEKWWVPKFIYFQYKCDIEDLNDKNPAHLGVLRVLRHEGLISPIKAPLHGAKEQDKEQVKEQDKGDTQGGFGAFWQAYPRKQGKGAAEAAWKKIKQTDELKDLILKAVVSQSKQWHDPKFIPHPSTWLNQRRWEDVVEPTYKTNQTTPPPFDPISHCMDCGKRTNGEKRCDHCQNTMDEEVKKLPQIKNFK